MNIQTFTYQLQIEEKGYSFQCLNWNSVYSQGETLDECIKNAIEVTELMLEEYIEGNLSKDQQPRLTKKKTIRPNQFQLTFDLDMGTYINKVDLRYSPYRSKQLITH